MLAGAPKPPMERADLSRSRRPISLPAALLALVVWVPGGAFARDFAADQTEQELGSLLAEANDARW